MSGENERGFVLVGDAAHIHGASEKGPRYDPMQSDEERHSSDNAVWLCSSCHRTVDTDVSTFSADTLRTWKSDAEEFATESALRPGLPGWEILTHGYIEDLEVETVTTAEDVALYRDHEIRLHNTSRYRLAALTLNIQWPEAVVSCKSLDNPPGTTLGFVPIRESMRVHMTGEAKSELIGSLPPPDRTQLTASGLLPGQGMSMRIRTVLRNESAIPDYFETNNALEYYGRGYCQYEVRGTFPRLEFIAPMKYDESERAIVSEPVIEDDGTVALVTKWSWP